MKKLYFYLAGISLILFTESFTINPHKTLWYATPAAIWEETLPLGDGRLGMMPDGGVINEKDSS